jgi:hypothetical protein
MASRAGRRVSGFTLGVALGLVFVSYWHLEPVAEANHLNPPCDNTFTLTEAVKENNTDVEDGGKASIKLQYPDGGPVDNGGLVRSIFAWRNIDNHAEVGWKWFDVSPSDPSPKYFAFWYDQGNPRNQPWEEGGAGTRDSFSSYKLDNDTGDHWTFHAGGSQVENHTFADLHNSILIWANSEVKDICDSAEAHFQNLQDKACNSCSYAGWQDTANSDIGLENPCFHTNLISATEFKVLHGPGDGETCT